MKKSIVLILLPSLIKKIVRSFVLSLADSRGLRLQENGDDAFCGLHTSHVHIDGVLIFVLLGHCGRLLTMSQLTLSHAY